MCVQYEFKSSWRLAIEKLANASLSQKKTSERLANESKPSWEITIKRLTNQIHSNLEKLSNASFGHFDSAKERLDELASHFSTIQN